MKDMLLKIWQNKKVVGFVGILMTAGGGMLTGQIDSTQAMLLVVGYVFPSFWPNAPQQDQSK